MDRFIVKKWVKSGIAGAILKSNMDRFIDLHAKTPFKRSVFLKSNMDRFIVCFFCIFC